MSKRQAQLQVNRSLWALKTHSMMGMEWMKTGKVTGDFKPGLN